MFLQAGMFDECYVGISISGPTYRIPRGITETKLWPNLKGCCVEPMFGSALIRRQIQNATDEETQVPLECNRKIVD